MKKNLDFELPLWKDYQLIAGVDEAGRGALAGSIIVAAVILPPYFQNPLIQDSKILSPQQRQKALEIVKKSALSYSVTFQDQRQIEQKNPLQATKDAMCEAINRLKKKPNLCLVDGLIEITIPNIETQSLVGGDRKSINIAAASIIAKVTRDNIMKEIHEKYPQYDWKNNKGYPNPIHIKAILEYGISYLHRRTYEPIKSLINRKLTKQQIAQKYKII